MSDIAFFDTENITPTRKKDDVKVKVLKILFIVLFLLLFVEVCTYFFIILSPYFLPASLKCSVFWFKLIFGKRFG